MGEGKRGREARMNENEMEEARRKKKKKTQKKGNLGNKSGIRDPPKFLFLRGMLNKVPDCFAVILVY